MASPVRVDIPTGPPPPYCVVDLPVENLSREALPDEPPPYRPGRPPACTDRPASSTSNNATPLENETGQSQEPKRTRMIQLGHQSVILDCPHCHATMETRPYYQNSNLQWLLCVAIFVLGGACGCCFIPFCFENLGEYYHECTNCNYLFPPMLEVEVDS